MPETNTSYRKLHPAVRAACAEAGWDTYDTYNDKCATDRKIAYCRNGWPVPAAMKAEIKVAVDAILVEQEIDAKCEWFTAERYGYGSYDKLIIRVPH